MARKGTSTLAVSSGDGWEAHIREKYGAIKPCAQAGFTWKSQPTAHQ